MGLERRQLAEERLERVFATVLIVGLRVLQVLVQRRTLHLRQKNRYCSATPTSVCSSSLCRR